MALLDRLTGDADNRLASEEPPPGQAGAEESGAADGRRRRGRRPGSRNTSTSKTAVQSAVAQMMVAANVVITVAARFNFCRYDDALSGEEMAVLTDGVVAEAMAHPKMAQYLTAINNVSPHVAMANALIVVAIPRLQRRGIIGDFAADDSVPQSNDVPVSMETGGAHGGSGGYGEREEYPLSPSAQRVPVAS